MEEIDQQQSRQTLDHWTMFQHAVANNWAQVMIPTGHANITDGWLKQYVKKLYLCYGVYWYFECERDAALFILRWR
jgi:DNA-nicking Smr family endonuclease